MLAAAAVPCCDVAAASAPSLKSGMVEAAAALEEASLISADCVFRREGEASGLRT